jgi:hypothetical protein
MQESYTDESLEFNLAEQPVRYNSIEHSCSYTDKKEKKIFLMYKEIQMGAVAKTGRLPNI